MGAQESGGRDRLLQRGRSAQSKRGAVCTRLAQETYLFINFVIVVVDIIVVGVEKLLRSVLQLQQYLVLGYGPGAKRPSEV